MVVSAFHYTVILIKIIVGEGMVGGQNLELPSTCMEWPDAYDICWGGGGLGLGFIQADSNVGMFCLPEINIKCQMVHSEPHFDYKIRLLNSSIAGFATNYSLSFFVTLQNEMYTRSNGLINKFVIKKNHLNST